ncbi:uncharacterized protein LOC126092855 [Schistocerca cancellata]|uniref:uncharacterized protein LOC126092855 n=1 Tax=Schistocerca cancellata TaxID=274614 RepID=UPI0021195BFF|nr:uncharacterized protein LOC126092855 [Schistocerca cancellata]
MPDTALQSFELLGPGAVALSRLGLWMPHGGRRPGSRLLGAAFVTAVSVSACLNSGTQMLVDTQTDPAVFREVFFLCTSTFSWTIRKMVLSLLDARRLFPDNGAGVREKYSRTASTVWKLWQVSPLSQRVPVTLHTEVWKAYQVATSGDGGVCMGDPLIRTLTSPPAGNSTRPLIFWLPVDVQHSPAYEITYAIQAVGAGAAGETSILLDVFFVVLLTHAASELAVLNKNIEGIGLSKLRDRVNEAERDMSVQLQESRTDEKSRSQPSYTFNGCLPAPVITVDSSGNLFFLNRDDKRWTPYSTLVKNIRHHQLIIA